MAVARTIVNALYMTPDGPQLRYHRGLPHKWDGRCWPEIAIRDVRSAAYYYLEDAGYAERRDATHADAGACLARWGSVRAWPRGP
jgi:hypothetical protein